MDSHGARRIRVWPTWDVEMEMEVENEINDAFQTPFSLRYGVEKKQIIYVYRLASHNSSTIGVTVEKSNSARQGNSTLWST